MRGGEEPDAQLTPFVPGVLDPLPRGDELVALGEVDHLALVRLHGVVCAPDDLLAGDGQLVDELDRSGPALGRDPGGGVWR